MTWKLAIAAICLLAARASAQPTEEPVLPAVARIEVRGNHRIEAETIRVQVGTKVGQPVDDIQLRADLHAIWKLGVFSDVRAVTAASTAGTVLAFEVDERPAIRKVLVAGNHGLALDKIDDVLHLRREAVADVAAIQRDRAAIAELYEQHGYYLATVDYELVPAGMAEVDVKFTVDEHAKIRVSDVEIIGNRSIPTKELRDVLATRPPNALSFINDSGLYRRDALERDLAVLTAHYIDAGFATAKVAPPQLRLSRDKRFMHVTITIDEGPRFTFGNVRVTGDLMAAHELTCKPGATFSRTRVERDKAMLETYYRDRGYASTAVTPRMKIDAVNHRIDIVLEVVRGKQTYIDRIRIRGNSKTADKIIRREMKLSEGELFSASKLEASRRRIFALGYFENVTLSTQRGSSDEFIDVDIEVRERRSGTLQIGAGFSSVEKFIAQLQVSQENFLGRGLSLSAQAQLSAVRRVASLRIVDPYFLDTKWSFGFELYNINRGLGTFTRDSTGGSLTWGRPLSDHTYASLTYRLEDVDVHGGSAGIASFGARSTPLPAIDAADLLRGGMNSTVRGTFGWDTRDNRMFPSEGWYATAFAEYAGRLTGSENKFVRWGGFARHYHHIGGPFVLRLNAELGVTTSLDNRSVPLSERYLLGGIGDIRGYAPRSLGPHLYVQSPGDVGNLLDPLALGGNMQIVTNAEIEFPLVRRLGISGVVFFDAGNAYNLESRFCTPRGVDTCLGPTGMLGGLRKSVGVGVRWLSPLGPLRFEWGIPLDLRPGERGSGLEFTIGTSF